MSGPDRADQLVGRAAFKYEADRALLDRALHVRLGAERRQYVALAHTGYGVAMIIAGLALAPFAWRILGPVASRFLGSTGPAALGKRVRELESIQADMTQTQAAELERIERGLHDGAQSRLVAIGMSMGAAGQLIDDDPAVAKAILAEARALALDAPVQVTVRSNIPSRPERPVESAIYFAVSELLANVAKHARARQVSVELGYGGRTLTATVTDDGAGGATASHGSGLNGIERRMAALGGHVGIDSPAGGPTRVTMAVPCVLS
jgi:signal transduction histidine kinase